MERQLIEDNVIALNVLKLFVGIIEDGDMFLDDDFIENDAPQLHSGIEINPTVIELPTTSYRKTPRLETKQEPSGEIAQMIEDEKTYRNYFMPDRIQGDALITLGLTKYRSSV